MSLLLRLAFLAVVGFGLSGCATPTPEMVAANDPFEPTNRELFHFNQKLDKYVVGPTAGAYIFAVPKFGRDRIHDLLTNLALPVTFSNDILQGKPERAKETLSRFLLNTVVGLGGLFDVASRRHMPEHREDFGQTLAVWGVGEGPYMVLPLIGPDPPRDSAGQLVDFFLIDPTHWLHYKQHIWWDLGHQYFLLLDVRAQSYQTLQGIQRTSVDYYASVRSLYRQMRNNEIRDGRPDLTNVPEY